jgi:beta-glucosidase
MPALFPFGYGLSYSVFNYSALELSAATASTCEAVTLSVTVTNGGSVASDEVVQAYASWEGAPLAAPSRTLVGFERIHLKAGASATVTLPLPPARRALVDDSGSGLPVWTAVPARVSLSVGGQQPDQATAAPSNVLAATLTVSGPVVPLASC